MTTNLSTLTAKALLATASTAEKFLPALSLTNAFAPMTAALYYDGLMKTMRKLGKNADSRAIDLRLSAQYGRPTRRVNYKRYAIIYFIEGDKAIIHRVMPQKMIK